MSKKVKTTKTSKWDINKVNKNSNVLWGLSKKYKGYNIKGWATGHRIKQYKELVSNIKNGIIVEVGVYGGASLLPIVDICKNNNNKIYGIDPWEKNKSSNGVELTEKTPIPLSTFYSHMKKNRLNLEKIIKELKYNNVVNLIFDFDVEAVKQFEDDSIDLVYIDGNHDYDSVNNDLNLWKNKIKKDNGIMWGDDYNWESVRNAVNNFANENGRKVKPLIGNGWKLI